MLALKSIKLAGRVIRSHQIGSTNGATRCFQSSPCRTVQVLNANKETFQTATSNKNRIVLVDFYADWCGPCKQLSPILEKLAGNPFTTSGSNIPLDLVTVNTDTTDGIELGKRYSIRSLPTVIAFKDGEPVDKFIGALNESGVRKFIENL